MQENDKPVLVYATFPSLDVAEEVGGAVVAERLAACVNILPRMVSIYMWKNARHRDEEVVLIAKTRASLGERLVAAIKSRHPYEVPAILIIPLAGGLPDFLAWIGRETGG